MSIPSLENPSITGVAKGLAKGMALVDIVAMASKPLHQSQLVKTSGIPHATTVRLLDVLCQLDVLRVRDNGEYLLGPQVVAWGQSFLNNLDITRLSRSLINSLVERSGETCFIGVIDRDAVLYVAAAHSPQPVRPAAEVGSRNPLHSTGIGKALLAFADDESRTRLLASVRQKKTPHTIVDAELLLEELERVRQRGYAIDDVENEEGVRCVAVPVRDHRGETVAAISVSAPAYRFSIQDVIELAPFVQEAADQLSRQIGYTGPPLINQTAMQDNSTATKG